MRDTLAAAPTVGAFDDHLGQPKKDSPAGRPGKLPCSATGGDRGRPRLTAALPRGDQRAHLVWPPGSSPLVQALGRGKGVWRRTSPHVRSWTAPMMSARVTGFVDPDSAGGSTRVVPLGGRRGRRAGSRSTTSVAAAAKSASVAAGADCRGWAISPGSSRRGTGAWRPGPPSTSLWVPSLRSSHRHCRRRSRHRQRDLRCSAAVGAAPLGGQARAAFDDHSAHGEEQPCPPFRRTPRPGRHHPAAHAIDNAVGGEIGLPKAVPRGVQRGSLRTGTRSVLHGRDSGGHRCDCLDGHPFGLSSATSPVACSQAFPPGRELRCHQPASPAGSAAGA